MPLRSSLDTPDSGHWQSWPNYSINLAKALFWFAMNCGPGRGLPDQYIEARNQVWAVFNGSEALPQRLRAYWVFARAAYMQGHFKEALEWINQAIEIALALDDLSALAALFEQRGALQYMSLEFSRAAHDYLIARAYLFVRGKQEEAFDGVGYLKLTTLLAHMNIFMWDLRSAESYIREAYQTLDSCSTRLLDLELAELQWAEVNLYRWRHEPHRALSLINEVTKRYDEHDASCSAVRAHIVAAELRNDIADSLPHGEARNKLLYAARLDIYAAASKASAISDDRGMASLTLTRVRTLRLDGNPLSRVSMIEGVHHDALRWDDRALIIDSFTALGREHIDNGNLKSGIDYFQKALGVSSQSDLRGLGQWAWEGLRRFN